jgi:aminoglycoside 6'-N-acetyltransferase
MSITRPCRLHGTRREVVHVLDDNVAMPLEDARCPMKDAVVTLELSLRGEQVRLRSTTPSDRPALVAIRYTPEVRRRWRGEDLEVEFDEDLEDDEVHQLTIESVDGRVAGLIQFSEEKDPEYRHASLDVYIDPALHGRGYATDAIRTLADFLFDQRGHHRLTIDPTADNVAAINCYAKAGFKAVGVMRSYERQADGTWADGLLMEMLADDRAKAGPRPTVIR